MPSVSQAAAPVAFAPASWPGGTAFAAPALRLRPAAGRQDRTKLWELAAMLHCSVIGTCLTTAELRGVLRKFDPAASTANEHDLHKRGVTFAGRHDLGGRLLHKALDSRHRLALARFAHATTDDAVRALWRDALRDAEIAGGYWATLTHPAASQALVREAFGDVHMLSHLVGAANRADIRRLRALEGENAALIEKIARQQAQLREAVTSRDAVIGELRAALRDRLTAEPPHDDSPAYRDLASALDRRLAAETRRRQAADVRLAEALRDAARHRERADAASARELALRNERDAIEQSLYPAGDIAALAEPSAAKSGLTVLYVGGRPQAVVGMRAAAQRWGATVLHHDGGVEDQLALLPGLLSRSDVAVFPVDCISHQAVIALKKLCGHSDKPFVALRAAGVSGFLGWLAGWQRVGESG